jgi:hypothetical protein
MLPPSTAVEAGVAATVACEVAAFVGAVPLVGAVVAVLLLQAVATSAAMANTEAKRFISSPLHLLLRCPGIGSSPAGQPGEVLHYKDQ